MADDQPQVPRILFIVDSTASMTSFLNALRDSLLQLFSLSKLLYAGKLQFGIIEYRDYNYERVIEGFLPFTADGEQVSEFVRKMTPGPGGTDWPEALKTGLNRAIDEQMLDERTLVIVYTDAQPHTVARADAGEANPVKERAAVKIFDWVQLCRQLLASGAVFTNVISPSNLSEKDRRFFSLLGDTLLLRDTYVDTITRTTVHVVAERAGIPSDISVCRFERPVEPLREMEKEASSSWLNMTEPTSTLAALRINDEAKAKPMQPIAAFATSLMAMVKRFQTVPEYRELVLGIFEELVSSINGVRSLTYNKVFGTLWREICKLRDDDRRQGLIARVSQHAQADAGVATWLEESYNRIEQVQEDIAKAPAAFPAFVLPAACAGALTQKDVLALARSCDFKSVANVMALLTRVQVVQSKGPDDAEARMIPLSLGPSKIFELIPHLLMPGMTYSRRPQAIVAMLALHAQIAPLVEFATAFIDRFRGKWLVVDPTSEKSEKFPENFAVDSVELFYKLREHLTDEERLWVEKLRRLVRLRQNLSARIECQRPTRAAQMQHDYKMECSTCGHVRSLTLFTATAENEAPKCGPCVSFGVDEAKEMPEPEGKGVQVEKVAELMIGVSHMVSCRKCLARYAVVNVGRLKVEPKCYPCRHEEKPRSTFLDCSLCSTRYVCASGSLEKRASSDGTSFVCAECKIAGKGGRAPSMEQTTQMVIREHLVNVAPLIGFDMALCPEVAKTLTSENAPVGSLFSMRTAATAFGEPRKIEKTGVLDPMPCRFLDYEGALERMATQIREGAIVDDCLLCCEAVPLHKLLPACGRCPVRVCESCISAWYGSSTPGNILIPGSTICPFCKQSPKFDVLRRANKQLCLLLGAKVRFEAGIIYAWCIECNKAAPLMAAECARAAEAMPDLGGKFRCEPCAEVERQRVAAEAARRAAANTEAEASVEKLIKESIDKSIRCPGCKAATVKEFGCNHISCPCGVHWCYECGAGMENGQDIYEHMYESHGSIGY